MHRLISLDLSFGLWYRRAGRLCAFAAFSFSCFLMNPSDFATFLRRRYLIWFVNFRCLAKLGKIDFQFAFCCFFELREDLWGWIGGKEKYGVRKSNWIGNSDDTDEISFKIKEKGIYWRIILHGKGWEENLTQLRGCGNICPFKMNHQNLSNSKKIHLMPLNNAPEGGAIEKKHTKVP